METILTVTLLGLIKAKSLYMQEVKIPVAYAETTQLQTKEDYINYVYELSTTGDFEPNKVISTLRCESHFNPNAIGDNGTSFGLAQIHLPAHPNITKEQALDPKFAIEFITSEFQKGNQWKWSCYKKLYPNQVE